VNSWHRALNNNSEDHYMYYQKLAALVAAGSFAILFFCAGPAHQIMPGYMKMETRDDTLGIILVKKNMVVADPEELSGVLGGGDAVRVYYYFFGREFPGIFSARSGFKNVVFLTDADDNLRGKGDGPGDLGGGSMSLPSGRYFVDRKYRYLLIFDLCSFQRDKHDGVSMIGAEGGFTGLTGGLDYVRQSMSFVMWDNTKATITAYGNIKEKIPTGGSLTKQTLLDLMTNIAISVNKGMPYRK
jgi:hypothetical protein